MCCQGESGRTLAKGTAVRSNVAERAGRPPRSGGERGQRTIFSAGLLCATPSGLRRLPCRARAGGRSTAECPMWTARWADSEQARSTPFWPKHPCFANDLRVRMAKLEPMHTGDLRFCCGMEYSEDAQASSGPFCTRKAGAFWPARGLWALLWIRPVRGGAPVPRRPRASSMVASAPAACAPGLVACYCPARSDPGPCPVVRKREAGEVPCFQNACSRT